MEHLFDFVVNLNAKIVSHLGKIASTVRIDRISVIQLADDGNMLKYTWPQTTPPGNHSDEKWKNINLSGDLPNIYFCLKSFMPFFDPVESLPEQQAGILKKLGAKSVMFIPLQHEGKLWGFMCCVSEKTKRGWKSSELSMVLQETIDITYSIILSETLLEIKHNDESLKYLLDFITQGIVTINENWMVTSAGGRILKLGGYVEDEIIGHHISEFFFSDDWPRMERQLKRSLEFENEKNIADDFRLKLKSGFNYWTMIATTPSRKQGVHTGFICLLFDIYNYKIAEEKLHTMSVVMNNCSELVWVTDMELNFTYVSPSIKTILGYTPDEAMKLVAGLTLSKKTLNRLAESFSNGMSALKKNDFEWKEVIPVEQFDRVGRKLTGELFLMIHIDKFGKPSGFIGITHYFTKIPFRNS